MIPALESRAGVVGGGGVSPALQSGGLEGLRAVALADLPRWKQAVELGQPSGFGCYFPFALVHQRPGRSAVLVTEDAGCLCTFMLRERDRGSHLDVFLAPMPMDVAVARRCLERANDFNGDRSARILRIDANDAALAATIPGLSVHERRQQYLYAPRAFGDLSGGKYRTLRRQLGKTRRLKDLEVAPYSERFGGDCRALLRRWSARHPRPARMH